ncbi:WYL domain-containing protein [Mucilaginibacter gossypiicola]|uniref:WYL domain-containing protein n=1 Tax=Mucilaginibacter gossypiicola TaxID=551995 RepID=A0A1H8DCD7_9SPHI|nr:WYL domain-containing protein [Mucilaginibacter gossypiicola]SEN04248.1 WYL domain-containing protein [Mucilaginibacter gossypiicola]
MISKLFSIGDIVAIKSHPYIQQNTEIIISGDHLSLSPTMVVTEIYKAKYSFSGKKTDSYKYKCFWFSTKSYEFEFAEIDEADLKLIAPCAATINIGLLKKGDKLAFKTMAIELGKKKSSLSYEDNSVSAGAGNTVINSLLSFLPPVIQLVDFEPHKTKHQLVDKKAAQIRDVSSIDVRVTFFDPNDDKFCTTTLPLETLEIIEEIDPETIVELTATIAQSGNLQITDGKKKTLKKPRNLAYRSGSYFLRGYDYLTNKVEEIELRPSAVFKVIKTPFIETAPKFDIASTPEAATPQYIEKEIIDAIDRAQAVSAYIRIRYKNRNEQLSYRTLKNYNLVKVKEGTLDVTYIVGFCLLRHDTRSFRTDRIQNFEQLALSFK